MFGWLEKNEPQRRGKAQPKEPRFADLELERMELSSFGSPKFGSSREICPVLKSVRLRSEHPEPKYPGPGLPVAGCRVQLQDPTIKSFRDHVRELH